jgi:putative membrane-bound dehydrogenase-like protein
MLKLLLLAICLFSATLAVGQDYRLTATIDSAGERVLVRRHDATAPVVTQVAEAGFRPYLHPLVAPDEKGLVTEFSPSHHKHQTGLYWGFTRLNGRDYFHHPESSYWKRVQVNVLKPESLSSHDSVQWQTIYDLLDESGTAVLRESQLWTMKDFGNKYVLELEWTGQAMVDVTVGKYDYGGLFLRMPWTPSTEGQVVNNARQIDQRAEGQRAVWTDVGMKVPGRDDWVHVSIFDHPQNKGFPQPWRVDQQLGIGPVRARLGDWTIAQGQKEIIRHQVVVSTGAFSDVAVTEAWSAFTGVPMATAQWQLAQQEGRRAQFLTPEKAVESMTLQKGFSANVYAAEPMIAQPMAFCWDAKGRIWIAENLDYETRQTGFANDGKSRISILEDKDRDGVAESRKTFLEGIPFPAGIAVGMGGLWLGAPPNLLFVPDRDGDDKADVDNIEVRLTGWGIRDRHETLNSFIWGPDGWLYGTQGYATPSRVGKPKGKGKLYKHNDPFPENIEFEGDAVDINGGVWRYHPTKDRFEVVAHGFSNPWGIDYDQHGQLFITACVIPHLWHVIPGGIYHRQGGTHYSPYVYSDIRTIADHAHQSAHGGARVYQSDAFPSEYRGRIFMANIHEHAVLTDILEPKGSGFVGRHGDDFMLANNAQWIGFSMEVGPEGAVYVLDWHDADICGKEVLNKDTGRIFRLTANESKANSFPNRYVDLNKLSDQQLVDLQWVDSVWHATNARMILQHRSNSGSIDIEAIQGLRKQLTENKTPALRLRALWTLHAIQKLSPDELDALMRDSEPHLRAWAIQLSCEDKTAPKKTLEQMVDLARTEPSPVVRLYLAASLQRVPEQTRWKLVEALSAHAVDADDHNIPKMLWFGLEPLVVQDLKRSLALAESTKLPLLARHIARRVGDTQDWDLLIARLGETSSSQRDSMLLGLRDSLEGRYDIKPSPAWKKTYERLAAAGGETSRIALQLSQQFGDSLAAEQMLRALKDSSANKDDRVQAIQALAGRKRIELRSMLINLMNDQDLRREAIRAIASYDDGELARQLIKKYGSLSADDKMEAVHTLATRVKYAQELTNALKSGAIPKQDVPAYVARQLRRLVGNSFIDVWGAFDEIGVDKDALFSKYRDLLKENAIAQANPSNGRLLFQRACASCHQLHGVGGKIGPDITGANRTNTEYLLSNILTPSAIIQDAYKMHVILLEDGRLFSGIPAEENERQLRLRIADREEPITIAKSEIESRQISSISMMPEGSLAILKDQEVLDLFSYLQSPKQVPLSTDTK